MREYISALILRIVMRLFYIFPVQKKRIVLTAYNGRQFADSPKYIALALVQQGGFDVYYALTSSAQISLPEGIRRVSYRSLKHYYLLMTAKYIVVNSSGLPGLLPYRKSQCLINTWHGAVAFKNIDNSTDWDRFHRRVRGIMGANTRVFLSSNIRTSEQYSRAMSVPLNRFLHIGLPRNDILFVKDDGIAARVRAHFQLQRDEKIVLYAPTFRDGPMRGVTGYGFAPLDVDHILDALETRFGGRFRLLFRAHHDMLPDNLSDKCLNASKYPDIQELIYASDAMITDYSSCAYEEWLMDKPVFIYAPDLDAYASGHTFGLPVDIWPMPPQTDNELLAKSILEFSPETNRKRVEAFFQYMGGRDTGRATETLLQEVIL